MARIESNTEVLETETTAIPETSLKLVSTPPLSFYPPPATILHGINPIGKLFAVQMLERLLEKKLDFTLVATQLGIDRKEVTDYFGSRFAQEYKAALGL